MLSNLSLGILWVKYGVLLISLVLQYFSMSVLWTSPMQIIREKKFLMSGSVTSVQDLYLEFCDIVSPAIFRCAYRLAWSLISSKMLSLKNNLK